MAMTPANAIFGNFTLVGQVDMEYSRFSKKAVTQATSALLGAAATSNVDVGLLNVSMNPKLRCDSLGRWRPYVQPIGLAFLVNSPASDDTTYLDIGLNFGAGLDIKLVERISLGLDVRYTQAMNLSATHNSYLSAGAHVGINF